MSDRPLIIPVDRDTNIYMTASSPQLTADDEYTAGRLFATRTLRDPELSSIEAIVFAQNRQGEFARGFNENLGGAAARMLEEMRANGATL